MAERGTRAEIDMVELEKLCVLHCSDREIADWFGVSLRTIERRRQEPEFAAVIDRGRSKGKISVRRMQMKLLEQGNTTMAIWLGKQLLGNPITSSMKCTRKRTRYFRSSSYRRSGTA